MTTLKKKQCVPCHGESEGASNGEIEQLKSHIPNWEIIKLNDEKRLERTYEFPDFQSALDFTNKVGAAAEAEGHHPALLTEYGKVTVTWWTHSISGLHENDFIMAAKTDELKS